jgi:hypothetical protein
LRLTFFRLCTLAPLISIYPSIICNIIYYFFNFTPFLISPRGEKIENEPLPPWGKAGKGVLIL